MEQYGLERLDQLEKEVAELPNSLHKILMEYEIKSIRFLERWLENIEKDENTTIDRSEIENKKEIKP